MRKVAGGSDNRDENGGSRRKGAAEGREQGWLRTAAHRDTPGGPVFLCLWANMWSESVQPYPTSRNCHENGRTESDNADFHGHKSALILRAACALVHLKKAAHNQCYRGLGDKGSFVDMNYTYEQQKTTL